eukprot:jgi/Mesvir1/22034/Mv15919-RA.1
MAASEVENALAGKVRPEDLQVFVQLCNEITGLEADHTHGRVELQKARVRILELNLKREQARLAALNQVVPGAEEGSEKRSGSRIFRRSSKSSIDLGKDGSPAAEAESESKKIGPSKLFRKLGSKANLAVAEPPKPAPTPSQLAAVVKVSQEVESLQQEVGAADSELRRLMKKDDRLTALRQQYNEFMNRVFNSTGGDGLHDEEEQRLEVDCRRLSLLYNEKEKEKVIFDKCRCSLFDTVTCVSDVIYCMRDLIDDPKSEEEIKKVLKELRSNPLHYGYYGAIYGLGSSTSQLIAEAMRERMDAKGLEMDDVSQNDIREARKVALNTARDQLTHARTTLAEVMEAIPDMPKVDTSGLEGFSILVNQVIAGYSLHVLESKMPLPKRFAAACKSCEDTCKSLQWVDRQLMDVVNPKLEGITTLYTRAMRALDKRRHELLDAALPQISVPGPKPQNTKPPSIHDPSKAPLCSQCGYPQSSGSSGSPGSPGRRCNCSSSAAERERVGFGAGSTDSVPKQGDQLLNPYGATGYVSTKS